VKEVSEENGVQRRECVHGEACRASGAL
jgi:hypothetical protein